MIGFIASTRNAQAALPVQATADSVQPAPQTAPSLSET